MSVYKKHELTIVSGNDYKTNYASEICKESDYDNCFDESITWRDRIDNMLTVSEKFPDVLFKLVIRGEDIYDISCEYYKNGSRQCSQAIIIFEDYDPSKIY